MIGHFEFNGVMSTTHKLVCKSVNRPLLPALRTRMVEVYGKSGVIDYGGGDYATRLITMHIAYIGKDYSDLRNRARDIAAWLSTKQWAKLIINDETDKYYWARVIEGIDFETLSKVGEADIVFECQPFAYLVVDTGIDSTWDTADFPWNTEVPWVMNYQFIVTTNTSFVFENPGTNEIGKASPNGSKSNIIITGTWTSLIISIGDNTLSFSEAVTTNKTLIIDNVNMEVTLDGINKLSALSGDIDSFLSIQPGINTIEVSGTGVNSTVTLDFRPMWL